MALFQKQPITNPATPLYTLNTQKAVLIIGLGNPGEQYENNRHNVGFKAIDDFSKTNDFPNWTIKKDFGCLISDRAVAEHRVILAKPQTFMNQSGQAVQAVQKFFRVYNPTTLVIYDELALPFGQLRARVGGSDAGHNGVKSLIQYIGDDFARLRIGIKTDLAYKKEASDFVLANFSKAEQKQLPIILEAASNLINEFITSGQLTHQTKTIL